MLMTLSCSSSALAQTTSETVPEEPENLDEPTAWQEGDPAPEEMTIPAQEPEQTSTEAPPCQPMDDDRPTQPAPDYVWVVGYWWWTNGTYVWAPGYWRQPPQPSYVYVSGYWTYRSGIWVYVRGGWAKPNTTVIVVYPKPRPVLRVRVFRAPRRIIRRHHRWRHHHGRRAHHRRRSAPGPGPRPGPVRGPVRGPSPRPGRRR